MAFIHGCVKIYPKDYFYGSYSSIIENVDPMVANLTDKAVLTTIEKTLSKDGSIALQQKQVANMVGISMSTLSRTFRRLKDKRFLAKESPRIADIKNTGANTTYEFYWSDHYAPAIELLPKRMSKRILRSTKKHCKTIHTSVSRKHKQDGKTTCKLHPAYLSRIKSEYHPSRAYLQSTKAKKEFELVMEEAMTKCGGNATMEAKKKAKSEEVKKIIEYIRFLKKGGEWGSAKDSYLIGMGNLIEQRPWRYVNIERQHNVKGDREAQIENFRKEFEGGQ